MITTVTMNPAIDKNLIVNNFKIGSVSRINETIETAGGKGINVSKTIHLLGGDTMALGFIGGENGSKIQTNLAEIPHDFSIVNHNTRVNIKIYDPVNQTTTDINDIGLPFDDLFLFEFKNKLFNYAKKSNFVCFCGSLPVGVSTEFLTDCIRFANMFSKTALDCSGSLLSEGVKACPFIIKPNENELMDAFHLKSKESLINCTKKLIHDYGITYVLLSQGSSGSMLITKKKVYKAFPLKVDVRITTGAGDSMLAGFLFDYDRFNDPIGAFKFAVACSIAAVMKHRVQPIDHIMVNNLIDDIVIEEFK